jgi:predicted phosphoribosyltransferase
MRPFENRQEAGRALATQLTRYKAQPNTIILALPRGGVPVAYEIAKTLTLPLDIFLVRKLGVPWHEELAMGAIADNDIVVLNDDLIDELGIRQDEIQAVIDKEKKELHRRNQYYRQGKPLPDLHQKQIILVDDGIATGSTIKAAILALKTFKPSRIILAVPVAPPVTLITLKPIVDEIQCVLTPEHLYSISQWYELFPQTSDAEVCDILHGKS